MDVIHTKGITNPQTRHQRIANSLGRVLRKNPYLCPTQEKVVTLCTENDKPNGQNRNHTTQREKGKERQKKPCQTHTNNRVFGLGHPPHLCPSLRLLALQNRDGTQRENH